MRVLFASTYIYDDNYPEFSRHRTGFGMMVKSIFDEVSKIDETFLLSQVITPGHQGICKHTWIDVFKCAKGKDWIKGIKLFFRYTQDIRSRCRYFYYGLDSGAVRKKIRDIKPDLVHIHGIGTATQTFIEACYELNIPFIVTLHGLIGFDDSVLAPSWDKALEKSFLKYADSHGIPVTVISSGMKDKIEREYLQHRSRNVIVICNGTQVNGAITSTKEESELRKKYNIYEDDKIIVVIGSICERKNQEQIIRALADNNTDVSYHVLLCGNDTTDGKLDRLIQKHDLKDKVHMLGFVPHEKISLILEQADLNVVASKDEGFGLSVIEAYSHGVPTVIFSDLDAVMDLYNENAMITVNERSESALANAIFDALSREWDREAIISISKKYSVEVMAKKYHELYYRYSAKS